MRIRGRECRGSFVRSAREMIRSRIWVARGGKSDVMVEREERVLEDKFRGLTQIPPNRLPSHLPRGHHRVRRLHRLHCSQDRPDLVGSGSKGRRFPVLPPSHPRSRSILYPKHPDQASQREEEAVLSPPYRPPCAPLHHGGRNGGEGSNGAAGCVARGGRRGRVPVHDAADQHVLGEGEGEGVEV
jgi:hypothetical protein